MRVVLGWHFDGGAWPDVLQGQTYSQGVRVVGSGGFLGILENRLGLPSPVVNAGVRMARMYGVMRSVGDATAFYAKSFTLDPWPTAERVLAMRDELVLAGWKRTGDLPRLKALAVLDAKFLAPGFADRLQRVREALAVDAPTGLREVVLVHHETQKLQWPAPWGDIFASLVRNGVEITHHYTPVPGDSDLGKIVHALETQTRCTLDGDGSLKIVRAGTRLDAAARLPELLGNMQDGGSILIRDNGDLLLDATLQTHGLPVTGCTAVSTARAAASLVRLFLQVRLLPFEASIWHAFLLLSLSPIPRHAASRLAFALEKTPCLGQKWEATVSELAAHPEKPFVVSDWLPPCSTSYQTTVAIDAVLAVLDMLEHWSSQRAHMGKDEAPSHRAFHAAVRSLCRDCAVAVKALAETALSPILLQRLFDGVLGAGLDAVHTVCASAPWRTLTHPGQVWGSVQSLLWWTFQTATPADAHFWTIEEQAALAADGVQLPDPEALSRMEAAAWLAPLRFARQVTLVLPEREGTEPAIPHPLLDALRAVLSDAALAALTSPPKASSVAKAWPSPRTLHPVPLPLPDTVSVTALSDLLQCPFKFYAEKQLRLASRLRALPQQDLTLGNLGHALMGALLADPDFTTTPDMTALCEEKVCTLPEVQALAGDVRPVFLRAMSGAAEALRDIMKARGLCYAEAEAPLSGMLSDTPPVACEGRLDLRFTDSKGKNVILDMKWTKASTRYGDLLEKDQDTQLAAYAGLDGNTTDAGYFLLRNGHVLWHEAHSSLTKRWQTIRTKVSSILQDWEQGTLDIKRTEEACTYCELRILCGENL